MSIKKAFDEITPTSIQKTEMLSKVKAGTDTALIKQRRNIFINRLCIVGAACLSVFVCVVALSVFINSTGKPISISGDRNSMIGLNSNINDSGSYADPAFPSDKSSKAEEISSSIHEIDSSIESVSSSAPETTTTENSEIEPPETIVTDPPAPVIEYAENITLKFIGDASFTQRGILYLIAVDDDFPDNDEILDMTGRLPSEEFYINTEQDGTKLLESFQCGVYVVMGPWFSTTGALGFTSVKIDVSMSDTTVEINLNTPDIAPEKVNNGQDNSKRDLTLADIEAIREKNKEEVICDGKKYIPVDTIAAVCDYDSLPEARSYLSQRWHHPYTPNFDDIKGALLDEQHTKDFSISLFSVSQYLDSGYLGKELYFMFVNGKVYDSERFSQIAVIRLVHIPNTYTDPYNDCCYSYRICIDSEVLGEFREIYCGMDIYNKDNYVDDGLQNYEPVIKTSSQFKDDSGKMITDKKVIFRAINGIDYYDYTVNNKKPFLRIRNSCIVVDVDGDGYMTVNRDQYTYLTDFYLAVLTREDAIKMGGYPIYRLCDEFVFEYMLTIPYEQFPDLCDDLSEADKEQLAYYGDYEYPESE